MPIAPAATAVPCPIPRPARRIVLFLAVCLVAAAPAVLSAQSRQLTLVQPADTPREHYSTRVPVGTDRIVVGLEATGSPTELPAERLVVYLPEGSRDGVCVSIRSIDGRYGGLFHFVPPVARSRAALLNVRSWRYPDELAAYTPERLAVSAWLAASCAAPPGTFVVVGRNSAAPGGTLRLSLNADAGLLINADITSPGRRVPTARCPLLEVDDAHAFNRVCTLQLPAAPGHYDLRLTLRIPGQEPQLVRYVVRVP
jgi:hypothetical protein